MTSPEDCCGERGSFGKLRAGVLRLAPLAQDFGCGLTFTPSSARAALAGDPELTPARRLNLDPAPSGMAVELAVLNSGLPVKPLSDPYGQESENR